MGKITSIKPHLWKNADKTAWMFRDEEGHVDELLRGAAQGGRFFWDKDELHFDPDGELKTSRESRSDFKKQIGEFRTKGKEDILRGRNPERSRLTLNESVSKTRSSLLTEKKVTKPLQVAQRGAKDFFAMSEGDHSRHLENERAKKLERKKKMFPSGSKMASKKSFESQRSFRTPGKQAILEGGSPKNFTRAGAGMSILKKRAMKWWKDKTH